MDPNNLPPVLQRAIARRQPGGPMAPQGGPGAPTPPMGGGAPLPPGILGGQPAAAMASPGIDDQTKKMIMALIQKLLPLLQSGGTPPPASAPTPMPLGNAPMGGAPVGGPTPPPMGGAPMGGLQNKPM